MNEEGAALPLAVFGLVVLSLLVTSAFSTASIELALSRAHLEAARGLYAANSAMESFVASQAEMLTSGVAPARDGAIAASGDRRHVIALASLIRRPAGRTPDGGMVQSETFSVAATPAAGWGRATAALFTASRSTGPVRMSLDAALTSGADVLVDDDGFVARDPGPEAVCDSMGVVAAIRVASNGSVAVSDGDMVKGAIAYDPSDGSELVSRVLGGRTMEDLIDLAEFGFGPTFEEAAFSGVPRWDAAHPELRWGCPAYLVPGCGEGAEAEYRTVVIDGNGLPVEIRGGHGQGVLLVRNGDLLIRDGFVFSGMLVVEGGLQVFGEARIEGAVIVAGREITGIGGGTTELSGESSIRFNPCAVEDALDTLAASALERMPWEIGHPTFGWFEIVK